MNTYKDTTYCVRECNNMDCKRNMKHLEGLDIKVPLSQASFEECEEWSGEDDNIK